MLDYGEGWIITHTPAGTHTGAYERGAWLCPMVAYQAPTSPINPPLRSWRLIRSWLALSFREDRTTLLSGARTGNRILTTVTFERFPSAMRPHWTQNTEEVLEIKNSTRSSCFNKKNRCLGLSPNTVFVKAKHHDFGDLLNEVLLRIKWRYFITRRSIFECQGIIINEIKIWLQMQWRGILDNGRRLDPHHISTSPCPLAFCHPSHQRGDFKKRNQ